MPETCNHPEEYITTIIDQYAGEIEFCEKCWEPIEPIGFMGREDDFYQIRKEEG